MPQNHDKAIHYCPTSTNPLNMLFKTIFLFFFFKPKPYAYFEISYAHLKWQLYAKSSPKPGPLCFFNIEAIMTEAQKTKCIFHRSMHPKFNTKILKTQSGTEYSKPHGLNLHTLQIRQQTMYECFFLQSKRRDTFISHTEHPNNTHTHVSCHLGPSNWHRPQVTTKAHCTATNDPPYKGAQLSLVPPLSMKNPHNCLL